MAKSVNLSNQLVLARAKDAKAPNCSLSKQIDRRTAVGRAAEENPDLPLHFVKDVLLGLEDADAGNLSTYRFG